MGVQPEPDDNATIGCTYREIYDLLSSAVSKAENDSRKCRVSGNSSGAVFHHGCSRAYGSISEAFEALQVTGAFDNSDLGQDLAQSERTGA